jgi:hypothetical protein
VKTVSPKTDALARRFPLPWPVEDIGAAFVVKGRRPGQKLASGNQRLRSIYGPAARGRFEKVFFNCGRLSDELAGVYHLRLASKGGPGSARTPAGASFISLAGVEEILRLCEPRLT